MTPLPSSRDPFLDCLKGFAIGTVVLGHTFQGATPDFDHYLPFRLVYSFHMPMFMFITGMTASLGFSKRLNAAPDLPQYVSELRSKALRLVVPFVFWAAIKYFLTNPEGYNPATWILHVLQVPDVGLWFLWILFQCSCVLALVNIGIQYAYRSLATTKPNGGSDLGALYLILILAWPISSALIHALPSALGLGMSKAYFIYFFLGFVFHIVRPDGLPNAIRWIPYLIFIALAPFWYRTEISPVVSMFPKSGFANVEYEKIVAFAGTLAFVDLVRLFTNSAPAFLTRPVAFTGKRSLDIYALHFYFLAYFPPVIAPIAISLAGSFVLRTNAVTSWLCFGQKPMNIWRPSQKRLSVNTSSPSRIGDEAVAASRE
jgi:fucose 4-O-acetylase-like acetyltransferase